MHGSMIHCSSKSAQIEGEYLHNLHLPHDQLSFACSLVPLSDPLSKH